MRKIKKYIAPIIVTAIMILYYAIFFTILWVTISDWWVKLLLCLIPVSLMLGVVSVCKERLNEIKKEEIDNDISKY